MVSERKMAVTVPIAKTPSHSHSNRVFSIFQRYRLVDWATQGYMFLVAFLILLFHNDTVPHPYLLITAHFVVIGCVHLLILFGERYPENKILHFLRSYYPILLYTGFYRETGLLNRMFLTHFVDDWLIHLEEKIFGFQPAVLFMEKFPQRWIAEILYASYFSYYLMIAGIGLALYLRDHKAFTHFLTTVSILFYLCYLTYIILPVGGPRIFWVHYPELASNSTNYLAVGAAHPFPPSVQKAIFYKIMLFIYDHFEAAGAAFPSSHVAVAWCTVWFSFRYLRKIRWFHAFIALLLSISTVYGRYHYVLDVIGGVLTALILVPLIDRLYRAWEQHRAENKS